MLLDKKCKFMSKLEWLRDFSKGDSKNDSKLVGFKIDASAKKFGKFQIFIGNFEYN